MNTKRFLVPLFNALEVPCGVLAALSINHGDYLEGAVFLCAAGALCFTYTYFKPYWDNGNGHSLRK